MLCCWHHGRLKKMIRYPPLGIALFRFWFFILGKLAARSKKWFDMRSPFCHTLVFQVQGYYKRFMRRLGITNVRRHDYWVGTRSPVQICSQLVFADMAVRVDRELSGNMAAWRFWHGTKNCRVLVAKELWWELQWYIVGHWRIRGLQKCHLVVLLHFRMIRVVWHELLLWVLTKTGKHFYYRLGSSLDKTGSPPLSKDMFHYIQRPNPCLKTNSTYGCAIMIDCCLVFSLVRLMRTNVIPIENPREHQSKKRQRSRKADEFSSYDCRIWSNLTAISFLSVDILNPPRSWNGKTSNLDADTCATKLFFLRSGKAN